MLWSVHCSCTVLCFCLTLSALRFQGRSAYGAAPDAAALVPAEVLAVVSASPEEGGGAEDGAGEGCAVTQVAWDGRQSLAAASASCLSVFSLAGLKERLAAADARQVRACCKRPAPEMSWFTV